ncbi:hypothetical protein [Ostreiculturibacter nitratireducens]
MGRILKAIIFLVLIGFVGLVGFAYLGDLGPEQSETRQPVDLNVGQ